MTTPEPTLTPQMSSPRAIAPESPPYVLHLYNAIDNNDWKTVKNFIDERPGNIRATISPFGDTLLHVATNKGKRDIVEKLVELLLPMDLERTEGSGETALIRAACLGTTPKIAEFMVTKNPNVLRIPNPFGDSPVVVACNFGHKAMLDYLKSMTPDDEFNPDFSTHGIQLLTSAIEVGFFDVALDLVQKFPRLSTCKNHKNQIPLQNLVKIPSAFPSGTELVFWKRWIYACLPVETSRTLTRRRGDIEMEVQGPVNRESMIKVALDRFPAYAWDVLKYLVPWLKDLHDLKLKHTHVLRLHTCTCQSMSILSQQQLGDLGFEGSIADAAWNGVVEFFTEWEKYYPDILDIKDTTSNREIFSIATLGRQNKVLSLIFDADGNVTRPLAVSNEDSNGDSMLHLAAALPPSFKLDRSSGAALQMQRELQWFKEVEIIVQPSLRDKTNKQQKTPRILFTEQHKALKDEGEKWMKDTATSCSVVAALIATIMFAAAFTIPGGNTTSGTPIFLTNVDFTVFIIADAFSLFSSSTSVLMFLGILTSRYREDDFLRSLPTKLIIGLSTLFFSIATMMVSFGATLVLMLKTKIAWVLIPIILFASIPVTMFALLQFPLLVEIFHSTFGPSILRRPKKQPCGLRLLWKEMNNFLNQRKAK
ncbi:PGG domain [Dillenia turbinata]|uniref:PGG domain n=1 Tax=Dillenia turbinata TaxID=194707 RepID=A0AAN8V3G2_9MAGN